MRRKNTLPYFRTISVPQPSGKHMHGESNMAEIDGYIPIIVGVITVDKRYPLLTGSKPNFNWIIFPKNGTNEYTKITATESPRVLNKNVQFIKRDLSSGRISFSLPSLISLFLFRFPSRMCFSRRSLAPGNELGNPDIVIARRKNNKPKTRNPNHQAPIQRGSFGVRFNPLGWS